MVRGGYANSFRRGSIKGITGGTRNFAVGRARQRLRGGYRQTNVRNTWSSTANRGGSNTSFRRNQYNMRQSIASRRGQFSSRPRYGANRMMSRGSNRGRFTGRRGMNRGRGMYGGRGGRRGGGNVRGRGGRGRAGRGRLNKESLDDELDAYMGEDIQKRRLDSDLDSYFGRSGTTTGNNQANSAANHQNEANNLGMEVSMDGSL